jgi:hypothetical protein
VLRPLAAAAALALLVAGCSATTVGGAAPGTTPGTAPPATAPVPVDVYGDHRSATYQDDGNWLCLPGRNARAAGRGPTDDPCAGNLDTTVVQPDGSTSIEPGPVADADAPIDCFYVYPTVSADPTPNSDMVPGPPEQLAALFQVARLRGLCRIFAPVYRQNTVASLGGRAGADPPVTERMRLAEADVVDAWKDYIAHRNGGRPFVLVGHSQGSQILRSIIRTEILGRPALHAKLVSALLAGMPGGLSSEAAPGEPEPLPACTTPDQLGCVITYSSFAADSPPAPNGLWGPALGGHAICTNPAALGGGEHALHAYLWSNGFSPFTDPAHPPVTTPFVAAPGLVHGECVDGDGSRYLRITYVGEPGGARVATFPGTSRPGWGLHTYDVQFAMGDLVDIVRAQSVALAAR